MLEGRVLWLGAADDARLPLLEHFGLPVQPAPSLAGADESDLCLMPLSALSPSGWPACGGLLLVDSPEQEGQWLAQAPSRFEVVREPAPALLLFERLGRLLTDAKATERPPALDALTGCLGRAAWTRQLMQRLAAPSAEAAALVLLDLDRFRDFNDQHGHERGDLALAQFVAVCRRHLGPRDVLGRWRGDAFALLVQRFDAESVLRDLASLLEHLGREPLNTPPSRWWSAAQPPLALPTASAGLAWLDDGMDFAGVVAAADTALLRAQRQGGAQIVRATALPAGPRRAASPTDERTQVFNRAYFDARLAREGATCDREGAPMALWLVDLHGLAGVNARQGHAQGDAALGALAGRLRDEARLVDWVARVRGSGFVVAMPRTEIDGAQAAHARLRQAVEPLGLPVMEALVMRERGESPTDVLARAWQARQLLRS